MKVFKKVLLAIFVLALLAVALVYFSGLHQAGGLGGIVLSAGFIWLFGIIGSLSILAFLGIVIFESIKTDKGSRDASDVQKTSPGRLARIALLTLVVGMLVVVAIGSVPIILVLMEIFSS
jgi:cellulose synthase/poly-beta-1,6-N-acetylglucosamine synthase-like glycosyltransferase